VDLDDLGEMTPWKSLRRPDERWPEPTMHEGDLAVDETTHENVVGVTDCSGELEDLMAPRVCPPVPADRRTGDGLCERRHGACRSF
jgi:hypothetical protein